MEPLLARLPEWVQYIRVTPLARGLALGALIYTGFFIAIYLLERRAGCDPKRYRSRHFFNDVVYTLFYKGRFYNILLLAAVTQAAETHLPFLQLHLLQGLPWYVGLAIFWVLGDLAFYWWHRFMHSNRFLWALHAVHHSQERLTLFTASRRHPVENLMIDVLIYAVGFHMLLGIPTQGWLPLAATIGCIAAFQHAQLDWRYGPLYRVIASPRFHSYHHSTDPAHANANYAFVFSVWDYLFGTAVPEQARPVRYGVDGIDFHESLLRQLVTPFRLMWQWRHAAASSTSTSATSIQDEPGAIAHGQRS
jgi:sterol desaturase/sphingolipid hydroxylase (fatty acid hydroxylase superfamily)